MATVSGLAVEACAVHTNAQDAAAWMLGELNELPEVVAAEMDKIIWTAIRNEIWSRRKEVRRGIKSRCGREIDAMSASAVAARASILETWATCDGKRLGDATGLDLDAYAEQERITAVGHERNARFYAALRKLTPDRAKVRNRVDPERANQLLAEAGE